MPIYLIIQGILFAFLGAYRFIGMTKGTMFDGYPWHVFVLGFASIFGGIFGLYVNRHRRETVSLRKG